MAHEADRPVPDRRLLEAIQDDLPTVPRPFAELARRCGLEEEAALERLQRWSECGLLREVSAILEPARLGFRTTLAAVQAPAGREEAIGARVSAHPGVSHNYLREHPWNLWFTLALPAGGDFAAEVQALLDGEGAPWMVLPALHTFKLGVRLRLAGGPPAGEERAIPPLPGAAAPGAEHPPAVPPPLLSGDDRALLRVLQQPLQLVSRPWEEPARRLGLPERELLLRVGRLIAAGVVRRIAGVLRHRQAGFAANGMACFRLPEEAIGAAGALAAGCPEVSHCYRRETRPGWPYGLYAMIHARTREECAAVAAGIARRSGCRDAQVLYSVREFKKQRIRYL